ncbi:MAG: polysaccharide deacetylase family protein [Clostridiales bacterium]|jgi:peptidoglycan/xylan/chitin deacetylase (PgdA/CDA1 family)|nr:polysaccharide deacetylase family protein [Clostridiales bacterium]
MKLPAFIKPRQYEKFILLLVCILGTLALRGARLPSRVKIPIFAYHNICGASGQNTSLTITSLKFMEDMMAIKKAGYTTIFFRDLIGFCCGQTELPAKPALVTLDDGYESSYIYAYPILKQLGLKATVFIIGASVGRQTDAISGQAIIPHFSFAQAREMVDAGVMDIQLHTYALHTPQDNMLSIRSRFASSREYEDFLIQDCLKLRREIQTQTGLSASTLAYPFGFYNQAAERAMRQAGVLCTVSSRSGINFLRRDPESLFGLKRIFPGSVPLAKILRRVSA